MLNRSGRSPAWLDGVHVGPRGLGECRAALKGCKYHETQPSFLDSPRMGRHFSQACDAGLPVLSAERCRKRRRPRIRPIPPRGSWSLRARLRVTRAPLPRGRKPSRSSRPSIASGPSKQAGCVRADLRHGRHPHVARAISSSRSSSRS
ncbi:hypothetical protein AKJ09_01153 [Labilithrix luteola]|uniref:Uncharacterized protein n=1 Tax=Labilithrix luteola TaxID=1391654 RepID=A0A0K1PMZ9_9BACT|nr:hypothetical protein AKJ09_01153 [Labilithrix luteola]